MRRERLGIRRASLKVTGIDDVSPRERPLFASDSELDPQLLEHRFMKQWPEEIAPLPQRTRSILRSTVILSSLVQVVSELIQNSLDANARSIQVAIDCDEWSCWVQDDGIGFTIDDLESLANNCKVDSMRYSTSKVTGGDQASFGFRGEGEPFVDRLVSGVEFRSHNSSLSIDCRLEHSRDIIQDGEG